MSDTSDGRGAEVRREYDFVAAAPCVLLAAGISFCAAVLMASTVSVCAQCVVALMPAGGPSVVRFSLAGALSVLLITVVWCICRTIPKVYRFTAVTLFRMVR